MGSWRLRLIWASTISGKGSSMIVSREEAGGVSSDRPIKWRFGKPIFFLKKTERCKILQTATI